MDGKRFYYSVDECVECGRLIEKGNNQSLCYSCANKKKRHNRKSGKQRRWYKSMRQWEGEEDDNGERDR